jgi:hypothetical protein
MNKILVTIIYICLGLVLSTFAQAEFNDDFNGKLGPSWEPVIGSWELQDGKYNGKGVGGLPGFSLLPYEVADGMEIEVSAMNTGGVYHNFLIVFSYVNESEVYFVGPLIGAGYWGIVCSSNGGTTARWQELAISGDALSSNVWYPMKVEIDKTTVRLIVDGKLKVEYTFVSGLPKGRIGLGVMGADSLFDEVWVRGVKNAFPVIPKKSFAATWAKLKS